MASYVPEHITLNVIFSTLLIVLICSFCVGVVAAFFEVDARGILKQSARNIGYLTAFGFPIGFVGYIAGYLSTFGRTSAIAQVLPAVLALIGALNLYVFGTDNKYRVVISYGVCLFAGMLFYGTQYGAFKRDMDQEFRLKQLIGVELRLKTIRKNLGLSDDFPSWIVGTEPK
jgi:hypothetical protein